VSRGPRGEDALGGFRDFDASVGLVATQGVRSLIHRHLAVAGPNSGRAQPDSRRTAIAGAP